MKSKAIISLMALLSLFFLPIECHAGEKNEAPSTRKERNFIKEGNKLYNDGKYRQALKKYEEALAQNPSSAVGMYNMGLSQLQLGSNPNDTTQAAKDMLQKGCQAMEVISKMGSERPQLAARANYNLGNVCFNSEDYGKAISYYKQALRLNPDDNAARRNLRIAQLKQQNQDQNKDDKNQDQNKDQNQDQNKDQNQDQNKDQNKDQQQPPQNQNQQQQPQPQDINQQTADQILKAMENKENQTRARVGTGNNGEKSTGRNRNTKNW